MTYAAQLSSHAIIRGSTRAKDESKWLADYRVEFSFNFNVKLSIIVSAVYRVRYVIAYLVDKDGGDDKSL